MRRNFQATADRAIDQLIDFPFKYPLTAILLMLSVCAVLGLSWCQAGYDEIQMNPDNVILVADAYDTVTGQRVWTHICDDGSDMCERALKGLEDGDGLRVTASVFSRETIPTEQQFAMTWGRLVLLLAVPLTIATVFIANKWQVTNTSDGA